MSFEANQGQTDSSVKFLARGPGYSLFLTQDSAVLSLRQQKSNAVLRMKLLGANAHSAVTGTDALPGKSNYFTGKDPNQWRTNVSTYSGVKYAAVYPGIDLVYHGNQRLLEYDFVLAPGADPRAIDLRFQGARKLSVNNDGALVINVGGSEVIEHAPVVYQEFGGQRQTVAGRYVLRGRDRVGFTVARYDRSQPLVIDPTLVYSTYLAKVWEGSIHGIAVDAAGNAYVVGDAEVPNFPTTPGFQTTAASGIHGLVMKLNASGSALVYATYLSGSVYSNSPGSVDDSAMGIAVDSFGNAYVTGTTRSTNFPITSGAFQRTLTGGYAAFVTKLNPSGSNLVYSTYLGGSNVDGGAGIAVDASGAAYVTGYAMSWDFPTTPGAFQNTLRGEDAFVTKLNTDGSALVYSTLLGGSESERAFAIAIDGSGNAYATGVTTSPDFPTTAGAFQPNPGAGGPVWAFITKLNTTGSDLVYSTYLGDQVDECNAIAVDAAGNAYVTGTTAPGFPTTPGAFLTTDNHSWCTIAFVTKLNSTGTGLAYSTYLGGSTCENGNGIAVDSAGNAYVTGVTTSSDFPTTPGAFQGGTSASGYAFITLLNAAGSALDYSTYFGGGGTWGIGIALDASDNVYVTGTTSSNFTTTPGALRITGGSIIGPSGESDSDSFVSKLSLGASGPGPVTTANLSGPLGNNGWYLGAVTVTFSAMDSNSPVSATYYSVDGSPYQGYGPPVLISSNGVHQLLFYSVDTANRQETPHGQNFKIDATPPVSHVAALPATATSPNFSVQWSGTDAISGIQNYSTYVSDNGGPFTPWLTQTIVTQTWFAGYLGHTYRFYSIAEDNAGNQENQKSAAEATTHVPQMPGDVNGDGQINCADIALVKASFGKRTGQPGFNPAADVNNDGVVNVLDLAIVAQKLIPGTSCP